MDVDVVIRVVKCLSEFDEEMEEEVFNE